MTPLIYYSFASSGPIGDKYASQIRRSARSLRAHAADVPVAFFVFGGGMPDELAAELRALGIAIHAMADYRDALAEVVPAARADVLADYPVLHKYLCLRQLARQPAPAQLLYVDVDTVFAGDPARLFARHARADLYAREEPFSRRSPLGYRPAYVDEDALDALCRDQGARRVAPLNTGCLLWNHGAWRRLADELAPLFDRVWRFTVDLADRAPRADDGADVVRVRRHRHDRFAADRALAYPGGHRWIKEQVALWLTLGELEGLAIEDLSADDVVQGSEVFFRAEGWTLAHYFSANRYELERWLRERAGLRAAPRAARELGLNPRARCAPLVYAGEVVAIQIAVDRPGRAPRAHVIDRRRYPAVFAALRGLIDDADDADDADAAAAPEAELELDDDQLDLLVEVGLLV